MNSTPPGQASATSRASTWEQPRILPTDGGVAVTARRVPTQAHRMVTLPMRTRSPRRALASPRSLTPPPHSRLRSPTSTRLSTPTPSSGTSFLGSALLDETDPGRLHDRAEAAIASYGVVRRRTALTPSASSCEPCDLPHRLRHLLAIGRVAAGRTLAAIPLADADRPFAVAQYTERVLDTLADATARPASLDRLRTVARHPSPFDLGDRLEAALDGWTSAARADLTRAVPAAEGVRFLANQAVHLYAVTHQVMAADQPETLDPDGATTAALTAAARAAQAADPLWANITTLARPTLEYATASRALLPVLDDLTAALQPSAPKDLDTRRALADLSQAATSIGIPPKS